VALTLKLIFDVEVLIMYSRDLTCKLYFKWIVEDIYMFIGFEIDQPMCIDIHVCLVIKDVGAKEGIILLLYKTLRSIFNDIFVSFCVSWQSVFHICA